MATRKWRGMKYDSPSHPRRTSCKSSYMLIINTLGITYFVSDTFMFPNFWEARNHFPWVNNEVQNMLNFELLSFYIR